MAKTPSSNSRAFEGDPFRKLSASNVILMRRLKRLSLPKLLASNFSTKRKTMAISLIYLFRYVTHPMCLRMVLTDLSWTFDKKQWRTQKLVSPGRNSKNYKRWSWWYKFGSTEWSCSFSRIKRRAFNVELQWTMRKNVAACQIYQFSESSDIDLMNSSGNSWLRCACRKSCGFVTGNTWLFRAILNKLLVLEHLRKRRKPSKSFA